MASTLLPAEVTVAASDLCQRGHNGCQLGLFGFKVSLHGVPLRSGCHRRCDNVEYRLIGVEGDGAYLGHRIGPSCGAHQSRRNRIARVVHHVAIELGDGLSGRTGNVTDTAADRLGGRFRDGGIVIDPVRARPSDERRDGGVEV
jgi:hypothetical protein